MKLDKLGKLEQITPEDIQNVGDIIHFYKVKIYKVNDKGKIVYDYMIALSPVKKSILHGYLHYELGLPYWLADKDKIVSWGYTVKDLNLDQFRHEADKIKRLFDAFTYNKPIDNDHLFLGLLIVSPDPYYETGLSKKDRSIHSGMYNITYPGNPLNYNELNHVVSELNYYMHINDFKD